jgi:lycopene beta-cyclase
MADYDLLFAGGGLASGLTAFRFAQVYPRRRIAIIEQGEALGGNHTWSFHRTDLATDEQDWVRPFITYSWPRQQVAFPERRRTLDIPYHSVTSERFHATIAAMPSIEVLTGRTVSALTAEGATLDDGTSIGARAVFDGRGPAASRHMSLGFQKFVGLELEFERPHGLDAPIIMDATVPQTDGYRFVYVLPFTPRTALIEDTYYADGAELPEAEVTAEIHSYAARQGWAVAREIRRERGVLPILLEGDFEGYWSEHADGPAPLGLRANLFHPVTGYSFPDAVRVAGALAALGTKGTDAYRDAVRHHAACAWKGQRFYRVLNRMLFRAAAPQDRYRILERFYGLPAPVIGRFYAGRNTAGDKLRILAGRPPVRLDRAVAALPPRGTRHEIEEGLLG